MGLFFSGGSLRGVIERLCFLMTFPRWVLGCGRQKTAETVLEALPAGLLPCTAKKSRIRGSCTTNLTDSDYIRHTLFTKILSSLCLPKNIETIVTVYVLCFMFCVLFFVFYVLCFVFYVLCFTFYVLCFMFYVLCFMFYVLCFMFFMFYVLCVCVCFRF